LRNVVLASRASLTDARDTLVRALARFPATIEDVALADRGTRLQAVAADADVEWIGIADADVMPAADAFAGLRRVMDSAPAIVSGRAIVGTTQRLGAMFGPPRSGPNPFDLVVLAGPQDDRVFTDLVRGAIDAPQRGLYFVSAGFVRSLGNVVLDPVLLNIDLGIRARAAGRAVICEPALTYGAGEDARAMRRASGDLRRFSAFANWDTQTLHRDPKRMQAAFITREVRIAGAIRGYGRRPYPVLDALVLAADDVSRARAQRAAGALGVGGTLSVVDATAADALRAALARTSDRHLLVADARSLPDRAAIESLIECVESSGRVALALERDTAPHGAAVFHCGRVLNAGTLPGATIAEVIAAAIERFPARRLFAATQQGEIVPATLPALPAPRVVDAVFVAASKPAVTQQTVQALMGEPLDGKIIVVYPAGAATTEKLFGAHSGLMLMPDDSDVQLAVGLNRALGACDADVVAIVRDDAQIPHGTIDRLRDAFRRIPRLGIAVPRVGGADRPESLPDLGYRNLAEMQQLYDRRAEAYAREVNLLDVATAPVLMVSREALEVVGGFDERFGFSRPGVEDFSRRMRAANFLVACCDDAYAHLFGPLDAASFVGNLDDAPFLRAAYEKRWSQPRGFDAKLDRVPLRTGGGPEPGPAGSGHRVRVLLPLSDDAEWERAHPLLVQFAAEFRVQDPVEIAIGLDGAFGLQTALRALRELLLASNIPMEETVTVSIDFVPDIIAWRDAAGINVRTAASERDDLNALPLVDGAAAIRALLVPKT
jgi:GT2 family glycosyltransferase